MTPPRPANRNVKRLLIGLIAVVVLIFGAREVYSLWYEVDLKARRPVSFSVRSFNFTDHDVEYRIGENFTDIIRAGPSQGGSSIVMGYVPASEVEPIRLRWRYLHRPGQAPLPKRTQFETVLVQPERPAEYATLHVRVYPEGWIALGLRTGADGYLDGSVPESDASEGWVVGQSMY